MDRLSEGFIEERSQPRLPSYGSPYSVLELAVNESGYASSIEGVYRRAQPSRAFRPMARRVASLSPR